MTRAEEIDGFLRRNRGEAYCDDCLSEVLSIRPRQQVQQKTKVLETTPGFDRRRQLCAGHGKADKLAVMALPVRPVTK